MKTFIQRWIDDLLLWLGLSSEQADVTDQWAAFVVVLLVAVLVALICRFLLLRVVRRIVRRTRVTWDDIIFNDKALKRFSHLLVPLILYIMLPAIFPSDAGARHVMVRLTQVYIVVAILRLLSTFIRAVFDIAANRRAWQGKPIKGLRQTGQGIVYLIGTILIISILLNRSPAILLTGLGASAAVLMLIFRDSILGFVSGIQLSANDMLKVGDWIAMPKYGADGTVEEVSLTTVKIRNWDNTIVTLPPYLLVSDSFQNWEGMRASGGPPCQKVGQYRYGQRKILQHRYARPLPGDRTAEGVYRADRASGGGVQCRAQHPARTVGSGWDAPDQPGGIPRLPGQLPQRPRNGK